MNTYLSNKNNHLNDDNTSLNEETHIYNIKGETDYISMTTFIHGLFEKFDEDKIIDNMMSSKNWTNNKYYGKTKIEIKKLWENNRTLAANSGTNMHYNIECFYNISNLDDICNLDDISNVDNIYDILNIDDSIEFQYFLNFYNDHKDTLEPYRTEWIVYDSSAKIAGSIDMVFKNKNQDMEELIIYDWKRCREIKKTSGFNTWSTSRFIDYIPDTNYWHYSLQLNGYKYILNNKYGKRVTDLYIVCLHPENKNSNYIKFKLPDLQDEIDKLFKERIAFLNN